MSKIEDEDDYVDDEFDESGGGKTERQLNEQLSGVNLKVSSNELQIKPQNCQVEDGQRKKNQIASGSSTVNQPKFGINSHLEFGLRSTSPHSKKAKAMAAPQSQKNAEVARARANYHMRKQFQ